MPESFNNSFRSNSTSTFTFKKTFYAVHALRDGTIWFASQTRKPRKSKSLKPEIDEDGIHQWFLNEDDPSTMTDWAKAVRHGTVANSLNVKRLLWQRTEPKLDEILNKLSAIEERITKIEKSLGERK